MSVPERRESPDPLGLQLRILTLIDAVVPARGLDGVTQSLHRLCRAAVAQLGVAAVAVHLMSPAGSEGVLVASDEWGQRVAELEFTSGEGPAVEAFRTRRPALIASLPGGSCGRWPGYAAAASDAGLGSVFAFPVHVGAAELAVLEFFRTDEGSLTEEQLAIALTYADIVTGLFLDAQARARPGSVDVGFERALDYRAEVAQAQGMVMVDLGTSLAEALVVLRAHAYTHNMRLLDLSRAVIAGYHLPDPTAQ